MLCSLGHVHPHPRPAQPCADRAAPLLGRGLSTGSRVAARGAPLRCADRCDHLVKLLRSSASSVMDCFVPRVCSSPSWCPGLLPCYVRTVTESCSSGGPQIMPVRTQSAEAGRPHRQPGPAASESAGWLCSLRGSQTFSVKEGACY